MVPVDDVPVNFSLSQQERTCTNQESSQSISTAAAQAYLASPQSLPIAECGYRACLLKDATASDDLIGKFFSVCSAGDSYRKEREEVQILNPVIFVEVTGDAGGEKAVFVDVENISNQPYSLSFESQNVTLHKGPRFPLQAIRMGKTSLPLLVNTNNTRKGEPKKVAYSLSLANGLTILHGVVVVTRTLRPEEGVCTDWRNSQCQQCLITIDFKGIPKAGNSPVFTCPQMSPGAFVSANFNGRILVSAPIPTEPKDSWMQFRMAPQNGAFCRDNDVCLTDYASKTATTWPDGINLFSERQPVSPSGSSQWRFSFPICHSKDGDSLCGADGQLLIRSLDKRK